MYLILKGFADLSDEESQNPGELNFREGPTMLLKTKENESYILDDPTISMKIKGLFS